MKNLILILSLLMLVSGPAVAQNYIRFNGGISQEDRAIAPETGQRLVFFATDGKFMAKVSVVVKNQAGRELVNTVTLGPWLVLNLPAGSYAVTATAANGEIQSLMLDMDGSNQEFGFMFRTVD